MLERCYEERFERGAFKSGLECTAVERAWLQGSFGRCAFGPVLSCPSNSPLTAPPFAALRSAASKSASVTCR